MDTFVAKPNTNEHFADTHSNDKKAANSVNAIIAGATGLIGSELVKQLLVSNDISSVSALVRRPVPIQHPKLIQIQDSNLAITHWNETTPKPDMGFICLGTTKKQAGSKQALAAVDVDLVTQVAQTMRSLGVKKIAVVSSFGADSRSPFHYLKCKGNMEENLLDLNFEQVVFVRPGPLLGKRNQVRKDEQVLQVVLAMLRPLLIGPLANFKPIDAKHVAKAMILALSTAQSPSEPSLTSSNHGSNLDEQNKHSSHKNRTLHQRCRLNSCEMIKLIDKG
ncbi:NAD(P)H-binding protein [Vibrio sp. TH_r3]|uniref:NAD(P)H-binding protein n=1 Tax=Vibrio sp. TH_r3 TaxID=3082084 RepID=UPI002954F216|nr:NAD(P)H-binding protein [Vibrio sp. TH_r3]MDV7104330.1 NAD(P)H-binding protein [Vibrio sp. TH_r3]